MSRSLRINTLYSKIVPDSPGGRTSRQGAETQRARIKGLGEESHAKVQIRKRRGEEA